MALYAMADFHLSLSSGKPMDIFGSTWENHVAQNKRYLASSRGRHM